MERPGSLGEGLSFQGASTTPPDVGWNPKRTLPGKRGSAQPSRASCCPPQPVQSQQLSTQLVLGRNLKRAISHLEAVEEPEPNLVSEMVSQVSK